MSPPYEPARLLPWAEKIGRSFLQGLLTQDVETLAAGELRFGALLTPQGRLLYDLFIVGREENGTLGAAGWTAAPSGARRCCSG